MRRTKRRWLLCLIALTTLSLIAVACGSDESDTGESEDQDGQELQTPEPLDTSSEEVIATFNGLTTGEVKEGEFNRFLNILSVVNPQLSMLIAQPEFKDQMLSQYVTGKSISAEVETTSEMEEQADLLVNTVKQQYEQTQQDDTDFAAYLEERGFSEDDLHLFFEDNMKVEEYFNEKVTDEELKQSYDKLKKDKDLRLYTAKIRHILIEINEERDEAAAKKRAEEVKQQLDNGGDFAELAKEYSDDPGSKEQGGSLGDEMTPLASEAGPSYVQEFAEAARDLPLNELSDPVKTQFGYHLIEVLERELLSFDQAKDVVQTDVWTQKYDHYVNNELKIDTKTS